MRCLEGLVREALGYCEVVGICGGDLGGGGTVCSEKVVECGGEDRTLWYPAVDDAYL